MEKVLNYFTDHYYSYIHAFMYTIHNMVGSKSLPTQPLLVMSQQLNFLHIIHLCISFKIT